MANNKEFRRENSEFQLLGTFEDGVPNISLCRLLHKSGVEVAVERPLETHSFVTVSVTPKGGEILHSALLILSESPEYNALYAASSKSRDPSASYIDDFASTVDALEKSDEQILDEQKKRKIAALFLRRKRETLTTKINHTRNTEHSMNEDVKVISGLKKMEKVLKVKPLSNREQEELIEQIFFKYQVFEKAVLSPESEWH